MDTFYRQNERVPAADVKIGDVLVFGPSQHYEVISEVDKKSGIYQSIVKSEKKAGSIRENKYQCSFKVKVIFDQLTENIGRIKNVSWDKCEVPDNRQ